MPSLTLVAAVGGNFRGRIEAVLAEFSGLFEQSREGGGQQGRNYDEDVGGAHVVASAELGLETEIAMMSELEKANRHTYTQMPSYDRVGRAHLPSA